MSSLNNHLASAAVINEGYLKATYGRTKGNYERLELRRQPTAYHLSQFQTQKISSACFSTHIDCRPSDDKHSSSLERIRVASESE